MTLSICSGNAPSSTIRFISVPNGPRLRLATNPSKLPAIALILPILRPSAIAVANVSGALFAPLTISNSFMTLAGAKKCVPQTSCGRFVEPAMMSMSMPRPVRFTFNCGRIGPSG
jgi:hypothetical protein